MASGQQDPELELAETFARVARLLAAEPDSGRMLRKLVVAAVETLDPCEFAGISEVERGRVRSTVVSGEAAKIVDRIQDEVGEGPCLDVIREHEMFRTGALSAEARWPSFSSRAHAATRIESVLSIRLFAEASTFGALNLYSTKADAFDDYDVAVATVFAAHAAVAMQNARSLAQLKTAAETRDVIGRAKGILMARSGVTDEAAFAMLRSASQRLNVKLRDLASQIADPQQHPQSASGPRHEDEGRTEGADER